MGDRSLRIMGLVLVASILLAYGGVFITYMRHHWLPEPLGGVYTQAPLALLASLVLLVRQAPNLHLPPAESPRMAPLGIALVTLSVALKIYGEISGYNILRGVSLIPLLLGAALTLYPTPTVRRVLFPILFLFFVIPMPAFAITKLTLPLQQMAFEIPARILAWSGLVLETHGYTLIVPSATGPEHHAILISEGCSGIRSLFSYLAVGSLYLHLRGHGPLTGGALLLALLPLSLVATVARILVTILLIRHQGPESGEYFFHTLSGVLFFVLLFLLLLLAERLMPPRRAR